ncbi:type VII secretion-associated serine protease mycosin [compost metagenome]
MIQVKSFDTPIHFAEFLSQKKKTWRKNIRSEGKVGVKRHVKSLVRKHIRVFRKLFGSVPVPQVLSSNSCEDWENVFFEDAKIVVSPACVQSEEDQVDLPHAARRVLRRAMHNALEGGGALELVSAKNIGHAAGRSLVAKAGTRRIRGLYLEQLGAAVVPNLTQEQVRTIEASGAIVLDNEPILLDQPVVGEDHALGSGQAWHLDDVKVNVARAKNLTGTGVTIGVLDTGIDAGHPEFAGKDIDFCHFNQLGIPVSRTAVDFDSHGTHVSGLTAGRTVGIAPDASLAVAAVLTTRDGKKMKGYLAQILAGLNWLASRAGKDGMGVDVINASLGGQANGRKFFNEFRLNYARGCLIVAAVGNDGDKGIGHHNEPASFEFVLAVGACDRLHNMASFSAWGRTYKSKDAKSHKPDLVAPGVGVHSAVPGGNYGLKNGTSMASPLVAGVAALLIQHDGTLRRNPASLKERILGFTCSLPANGHNGDAKRYGRGCLDLTPLA